MRMVPSRRDLYVSWMGLGFAKPDCKASEGVVATPWREGGNMGT